MSYTTLDASYASTLTLTAGTYYMSGNVDMNSNTLNIDTSSGDVILKRNGDVYFTEVGHVNTTDSTNKFYYTVKDDDTIGETIDGSSGSPSVSGGQWTNATITGTYNFIATKWEIRWVDNLTFVSITNKNNKQFTYITFKNCSYTSVTAIILNASYWDTTGVCKFQYIEFGSTNTMSGTGALIENHSRVTAFDHIYINSSSSSNSPIYFHAFDAQYSTPNPYSNIYIKSTGAYGLNWYRNQNTAILNLKDSSTSVNLSYAVGTHTFTNCLFDSTLNGDTTYAITRIDSGLCTININNCIFNNWTKVFYNREYGGSHTTTISAINSIFTNNDNLLNNDDLGHQTATYCGYNSNVSETYWSKGTGSINADPAFSNAPSGCVIDTTFDDYIPNGWFVTSASYEELGSDTFNNLSIDETQYTATGYEYAGTDTITPGINYLVTAFAQGGGGTAEVAFNLPQITVSATGVYKFRGNSPITLPQVGFYAEGTVKHIGECTQTLPQITVSTEVSIKHTSESTVTLPVPTIVVEGTVQHIAEVALNLPQITISSEGLISHTAESSITLPQLTLTAEGSVKIVKTDINLTLPQVGVYAEGGIRHSGTGTITLPQVDVYTKCKIVLATRVLVADADTWLNLASTSTNYGTATTFTVANSATNNKSNALFHFNLSGLSKNLKIRASATGGYPNFSWYVSTITASYDRNIGLYKNLNELNETGATWNKRITPSTDWAGGANGCNVADTDYLSTSLGSAEISSIGSKNITISQDKWSILQSLFGTNLGLLLRDDDAGSVACNFTGYSRENAGDKPTLTISYQTDEPVFTVTLPQITVSATGYVNRLSNLMLPQIQVSAEGIITHTGESSITLPQITLYTDTDEKGWSYFNLPQITLSAEGSISHIAEVSLTLPQLTLSADGTIRKPGEASITLPQIQLTSEGVIRHPSESSLTLPIISLSSEGVISHTGESSITLPIISINSEGFKRFTAESALALPQVQVVTECTIKHTAESAITLPQIIVYGTKPGIYADVAITLPQIQITAECSVRHIIIDSAFTLPQVTFNSEGIVSHYAESAITLPQITLTNEGIIYHYATSAITLPQFTLYTDTDEKGWSYQTLPQIQVSAEGTVSHTGTSNIILPQIQTQNEGVISHSGEANITLPLITTTINDTFIKHIGSSDSTLPQVEVNAEGNTSHSSSSDLTLPQVSVSAEGNVRHSAIASFLLPIIVPNAEGGVAHSALVALTLPVPVAVGDGNIKHPGTSDMTLPVIVFWNIIMEGKIELNVPEYLSASYKIVLLRF